MPRIIGFIAHSHVRRLIMLADSLGQLSKAAYGIYAEIEEAKIECDKVARDLHAATLEVQAWKQATAEAKAAVAHQVETIESQNQTIAELEREVSQWKDQSRNWQGHFLRVEQERCRQSSRINELLRQHATHPHVPFPISSKEVPQPSIVVQNPNLNSSKRKTNSINTSASSSRQLDAQTSAAAHTTLIRRVQAVIQVKHESDDVSGEDEIVGVNPRRSSWRSRRIINDDDDDMEQHYLAADGNPVLESRHLRHRKAVVNYQEEDNEDDDDDDELMMGAEENHDEVYGTQRIETLDAQRSKQHPTKAAAPPKKKRRLAVR